MRIHIKPKERIDSFMTAAQRAGLPGDTRSRASLGAHFPSLSCSDQPLQIHHKLGILGYVQNVLAAECLI